MTTTTATRELTRTFRSMASDIELRVVDPRPGAEAALDRATEAVRAVATHLTRFEATSALSRANRLPDAWHRVPRELAEAVAEAERAYRHTGDLFDPRVLDVLLAWGYDRTFDEVLASPTDPAGIGVLVSAVAPPAARAPWRPTVLPAAEGRSLLHLGGDAIDLGGIGKGLAVRRAALELAGAGASVLVDAGGDEWLGGAGPDGDGWKVGVEDPHGGEQPVLVLSVSDLGCATSSVRRRRWDVAGRTVHHLVDPRTGAPGGPGLAAVTVLHADPAWAEVWSKTLFLAGEVEVAAQAHVRDLAAAWVGDDGGVHVSAAMEPHVLWRAVR
ncbi:MAG: FAD:protein FMN transferase [Cellulomonas sp.]|nr:FAD:protein FMN transferase [Cellulomonas sp.]